jgi:exodeoxyribonuclease V alpha subunit
MAAVKQKTCELFTESGYLSDLDIEFAAFIARHGADDDTVKLCAALASRQSRERHLCLDFDSLPVDMPEISMPATQTVLERLQSHSSVGSGDALTPLVLDGNRLYLRRHYLHERLIAREITARAVVRIPCDETVSMQGLNALFPDTESDRGWQKCAALNALMRGLSVITGGPGTGKTTVVVRVILLAMYEEMMRTGRIPSVALCAPTGKAAAHMFRSVSSAVKTLEAESAKNPLIATIVSHAKDKLPSEGITIHRLLGSRGRSFVHGPDHRLPYDIIAVDECSMADAELFAQLLSSVDDRARLILLGDARQLSSVEAGSVMGDICESGDESPMYSAEYVEQAKQYAGISVDKKYQTNKKNGLYGSITSLTESRRFSDEGGIGKLASLVNAGKGKDALSFITSGDPACSLIDIGSDTTANPFKKSGFRKIIDRMILSKWQNAYDSRLPQPLEFFTALQQFQFLCAVRKGPCGSVAVNLYIEELLDGAGCIHASGSAYHGMPVIITENDHGLKLYNGDAGILFKGDEGVRACFPSVRGDMRSFIPLQISAWERAYALTIHKSQGSEYDHVAVLLPSADSPILTRELLYTAVTRAKKSVTVISRSDLFIEACSRKTVRNSGLGERLWS